MALVFAMAGGAVAANNFANSSSMRHQKKRHGGLTAKQKKEVKKIAKSFQGTGPAGAPGTTGSAGPKGETGAPGAPGAPGLGVKVEAAGEECEEGGTKFSAGGVEEFVCNGSPWTAGGNLPAEATETGSWAGVEGPSAVSFTLPLEAPLGETQVHKTGDTNFASFCPGSVGEPQAEPGQLCIYKGALFGATAIVGIFPASASGPAAAQGAATAGAAVFLAGGAGGWGTWAVTAP